MTPIREKAPAASEGKRESTSAAYVASPANATKSRPRRRRASWPDYEAAKATIARVATNATDYTVGIRGWLARRRL